MKNLFHITEVHSTEVTTAAEEKNKILIIKGWYDRLEKEGSSLKAFLGRKRIVMHEERAEGIRIRLKYLRVRANIDVEFTYRITLPGDMGQCNSFVLYETENPEKAMLLKLPQKAFDGEISRYWMPRKQKIREIRIQEGMGGFYRRLMKKLGREKLLSYEEFCSFHKVSEAELQRQKRELDSLSLWENADCPMFYILCCGGMQGKGNSELADSLKCQSYGKWKLLEKGEPLEEKGYVLAVDQKMCLSPEAFYLAYQSIKEEPETDFLYGDEDYGEGSGKRTPDFKPDANEDLLRSRDYIGSFCLVKTTLYEASGGYGKGRYDYHLRCWEKAGKIRHIPKVLVHNLFPGRENWNREIAQKSMGALEDYYARRGIRAEISLDTENPDQPVYHTRYRIEEEPLVSIVIPNKDHKEDLQKCVDSILEKSTYCNYEILIAENNSTEEETFAFYRNLEKKDHRVKILFWKSGFNYSGINNFAVSQAKGKYLLFLNNDTEVIEPSWIEELLGRCLQEDVGIVGAQLYYGDGTIQHAGVIIGMGGLAGHAFGGLSPAHAGYRKYGCAMQDFSAVTAACMMVKRSVFDRAGGFCEALAVAFNDIDLCLNVRNLGKLVVYNPYARLYHHESKSRGMEDTPEKVKRFHEEVCLFAKRHPWIMKKPDPYYNPNLTIDRNDFSLNDRIPKTCGTEEAVL